MYEVFFELGRNGIQIALPSSVQGLTPALGLVIPTYFCCFVFKDSPEEAVVYPKNKLAYLQGVDGGVKANKVALDRLNGKDWMLTAFYDEAINGILNPYLGHPVSL